VQRCSDRGPQSQKTTHGTITKLFEKFGYVNDDIFFVRNLVTGGQPRVGDHVSVVADHTPGKAAKWTARPADGEIAATPRIAHRLRRLLTRICASSGSGPAGTVSYGTAPAISPSASAFDDLFHVTNGWSAAFPIGSPIRLGCRTVNYHVFPREVDPLTLDEWSVLTGNSDAPVLEPQDQDYRYSAKVMLLSSWPSSTVRPARWPRPPPTLVSVGIGLANALSFLCGFVSSGDSKSGPTDPLALVARGARLLMARMSRAIPWCWLTRLSDMPGAWLGSICRLQHLVQVHGAALLPREPRRSSRAAIRAKQQARLENCNLLSARRLDCRSRCRTMGRLTEIIGQRVDALIYPPPPPPPPPPKEDEQGQPAADDADASSAPAETENAGDDGKLPSVPGGVAARMSIYVFHRTTRYASPTVRISRCLGDASRLKIPKRDTLSCWQRLAQLSNLQAMKVADLRRELEVARSRFSRRTQGQLVARLEEVLREEAEGKGGQTGCRDEGGRPREAWRCRPLKHPKTMTLKNPEKPRVSPLSDREQDRIRRHHRLPDTPALPAWPSRTAKGGRLRLESASLSQQLLSNRLDSGGRESAFEVALFCEQFHEMLLSATAPTTSAPPWPTASRTRARLE
uniref:S1-like domain-containing protein n=1 Tax=Macrostomum lignano TaxID=282301 RepID=A0A1I8FEQ5_9PLAT